MAQFSHWHNEKQRNRTKCQKLVYLVKLCDKQVERSKNSSIGSEIILLHHFLVPDSISNVDVCPKRKGHHSRIKVDDIATKVRSLRLVDQSIKKRCFSSP